MARHTVLRGGTCPGHAQRRTSHADPASIACRRTPTRPCARRGDHPGDPCPPRPGRLLAHDPRRHRRRRRRQSPHALPAVEQQVRARRRRAGLRLPQAARHVRASIISRLEPREALVEAVRRLDPAYFNPDAMVLMGNFAGEADPHPGTTRDPSQARSRTTRHARRKRAVAAPGTRGRVRRHRQAHHRHHVLRKLLRRVLPRQQQEEDPRDGRRRAVAGDRHQTADPRATTVRAVIPRQDASRKRQRRASVRGSYGSDPDTTTTDAGLVAEGSVATGATATALVGSGIATATDAVPSVNGEDHP